ncbi:hypothetical protein GCK72_026088 [Caenorhabditis remanei]|uniref:Uncharacterized protein n=1 Tax=Caenorhabditis remanei TaxID=31234 RepID=A0A6A5G3W8_CAERE|nr:hypothetical protein GCK72_026088 [Caenorhabditis remanei]KAF1749620.1 hypothetical protein GCK72_026088 [Caenorhabditis remanei]
MNEAFIAFSKQHNERLYKPEQTLTNDLCYNHQIVFHPAGLPVPLYIAGRYSQRGAMVLAHNGSPITNKEVYQSTSRIHHQEIDIN